MKKLRVFLLTIVFLFSCNITVSANTVSKTTIIKRFKNGCYIESTIHQNFDNTLRSTVKKKYGCKTIVYRSRTGKTIWSVSVKGYFRFNGKTSVCTNSSVSTTCLNRRWKITNSSTAKTGATATASATAKKYIYKKPIKTIIKTVRLTCTKNGKLI